MSSNHSERVASQSIEEAFKRSFDHVRMFSNIVIPLPQGRYIKTAEMDCVVVCDAGVFVFEVKGWGGSAFVERIDVAGQEKKQWVLRNPGGRTLFVADPVAQGVEKMMELRQQLPPDVMSQNYVVVTGEHVELSGRLPSSTIALSDLPFLARMVRTNAKRSKKSSMLPPERVQAVAEVIEALSKLHTHEEHVRAVLASKAAAVSQNKVPSPVNELQHVPVLPESRDDGFFDMQVQVSLDRSTVWVHGSDGSTVGRFSKQFGMDIHTTVTAQLEGASQCLYCTHEPAGLAQWHTFVRLMAEHYQVCVPVELLSFNDCP